MATGFIFPQLFQTPFLTKVRVYRTMHYTQSESIIETKAMLMLVL